MLKNTLHYMVQFLKQMNTIEETQSMLKSDSVLKKNVPLFLNIISSLFLVHFQWYKVLWVRQIKIDINYFTSRGKRTTQKSHEKYKCAEFLNVNYVNDQTLTPLTFDNHIFFILCPFWTIQMVVGAPNQGFKNLLHLKGKGTMYSNFKFFVSLSVSSLAYFVRIVNELQLKCAFF